LFLRLDYIHFLNDLFQSPSDLVQLLDSKAYLLVLWSPEDNKDSINEAFGFLPLFFGIFPPELI